MRKYIRLALGLVACGVLLYSSYQIYTQLSETSASTGLNATLTQQAVTSKFAQEDETDPAAPMEPIEETEKVEETEAPEQTEPTQPPEVAPISVNFDTLQESNPDIIAWLYSEDTPISLPIVQAADNEYYLHRLFDGTQNAAGTLFADYRCAGGFSGLNTVVYGHNMKNGTMFGTLQKYGTQEYYEEHPIMWLLTPDGDYKVELISGYVTSATSEIYAPADSDEDMMALAKNAVKLSTFDAGLELEEGDRYLTLSTCSYEYDNARYVVVGRLVPLE